MNHETSITIHMSTHVWPQWSWASVWGTESLSISCHKMRAPGNFNRRGEMIGKWSIFEEKSLYQIYIYISTYICIYIYIPYPCTIYSEYDKTAKLGNIFVRMESAAYDAAC